MSERPTALVVLPVNIPDILKREDRWVLWSYVYEERRDAWLKIPFQRSGEWAAVNRADTWCTYAEAWNSYLAQKPRTFDGIGFVLGWGWAGVDLDDCFATDLDESFRPVKRLLVPAAELIEEMDCYTEVSPSGDGVKLFCRSPLTGFEVRYGERTHVVPQRAARYYAVTGQVLGSPRPADVDRTEVIDRYCVGAVAKPLVAVDHARPAFITSDRTGTEHLLRVDELSDEQLIIYARTARNGAKFNALWSGEWRDYASRSEADLALCCLLAYWTQRDEARMDRMFRVSGLYRRQWDRESYRRVTLSKALGLTTAVFLPSDQSSFTIVQDEDVGKPATLHPDAVPDDTAGLTTIVDNPEGHLVITEAEFIASRRKPLA